VSTRITVLHDTPDEPAAFEAGYPDKPALARKLPGIQELEVQEF
jgi:hypothetical protein